MIDIHSHTRNQQENFTIYSLAESETTTEQIPNCFYSYGIHPWDINLETIDTRIETLKNLASKGQIIAVGECGLDRLKGPNINLQLKIFLDQIEVANDFRLPVIIHNVKSTSDLIGLMKKGTNKTPWILHGFSGNLEEAKKIINHGGFLSFGKKLLTTTKTRQLFKHVEITKVFLETDASNLTISDIYHAATSIKKLELEEMKSILRSNFYKIFNKEIWNGLKGQNC